MLQSTDAIRAVDGAKIGTDGATNVLSRSISNLFIHTLLPFFIEYHSTDLNPETAENVTTKVFNVLQ